jgi:deazaflavin-dependent oxidoreductase (nitroreductase family)
MTLDARCPRQHAACIQALELLQHDVEAGMLTGIKARAEGDDTRMDPQPRPYIRPSFVMVRVVNPIVQRLGGTLVLVVPGRSTGEPRSVPLGRPFEFEGARYLVSGRGETQWARNLRAASRAELRFRGTTEPFVPAELTGADRERVVAAYRARYGRRVEGLFRRIPEAADHPVFRIDPVDAVRADQQH